MRLSGVDGGRTKNTERVENKHRSSATDIHQNPLTHSKNNVLSSNLSLVHPALQGLRGQTPSTDRDRDRDRDTHTHTHTHTHS